MSLKKFTCMIKHTPISIYCKRMFNAGVNNLFSMQVTLKFFTHFPRLILKCVSPLATTGIACL
jgi:hypothetical protein